MYRLHKWLGIAGLVLSISHWLIAKGPGNGWWRWVGWSAGPKDQRPLLPDGSLQKFFMEQRGLAEGIGEWAFTSPPCSWCNPDQALPLPSLRPDAPAGWR